MQSFAVVEKKEMTELIYVNVSGHLDIRVRKYRTVNTEGQLGRELWSKAIRITMIAMIDKVAVTADTISHSHQFWNCKVILLDTEEHLGT